MTQQYTTYIKAHQDRIEREQQLVAKYNQKPLPVISKKRKRTYDVIEAVIGCIIVAVILIASMFI